MKKITYGRRQVLSTVVKLAILSTKPAGDKIRNLSVASCKKAA